MSWLFEGSGIELTYDDTENVMIIDGQNLPCYIPDGCCKPTTKIPFTLVWFSDDFCSVFTIQDFIGRMKIENRYCIETDSSSNPKKPNKTSGIEGTAYPHAYAPHKQNPHNPSLSRFEVFQMLKLFVVNLNLYILHNTQSFL